MSTIIDAIVAIFEAFSTWLTGALPSVSAIFYADGSLTFIGTMSIISIAIGVAFLLMNTIKNFVKLR